MAFAVLCKDLVNLRHGVGDFAHNLVVNIGAVLAIDEPVAAIFHRLLALCQALEDRRQVVLPVLIAEVRHGADQETLPLLVCLQDTAKARFDVLNGLGAEHLDEVLPALLDLIAVLLGYVSMPLREVLDATGDFLYEVPAPVVELTDLLVDRVEDLLLELEKVLLVLACRA